MKTILSILLLAGVTVVHAHEVIETGVVTQVAPRFVQIPTSQYTCQLVQEQYPRNRPTAGAALGGLIGGALGTQVGSGSGTQVATVVGAVAGTIIGDQLSEQHGYRTVERCYNTTTYHREQQGYDIMYLYNGRTYYTTILGPVRVGDHIQVQVVNH